MKHIFLLTFSSFAAITFLTGCTGQMVSVDIDSGNKEKECMAIDKDLIQLDKFMIYVKKTSAFDLEELAIALPTPDITLSTNKKTMLRDAEKKYAKLMKERKSLGCEPIKK